MTGDQRESPSSSDCDLELLALAEATLVASGFETIQAQEGNLTYTSAISSTNLVVVSAFYSVRSMLSAEPELSAAAARLLIDRSALDGYLVLLTSQSASVGDARPIYDAMYNLRYLRRIVRADVEPDVLGVARALRPVLPIASAGSVPELDLTPLRELQRRLVTAGVSLSAAEHAIQRFAAEDDPSIDDSEVLEESGDSHG